jgi:FkbM family methyltransferase
VGRWNPGQTLRDTLNGAAMRVLGRRSLWRLGRALYKAARNDGDNDPARNGERWVQARVLELFAGEPRTVVFDVGANVGSWSAMLLEGVDAARAAALEVHAFEPVESTMQSLRARLGRHPRFGVLRLVPAALSDADGTVEMYEVEPNGTTNSLHPDPFQPSRRVSIPTRRADSYCEEHGIHTVHLLKVDAEGHDFTVLRGAERLFREERVKVAQFEYNHRWVYGRHYLKDVFDFVQGLPYAVGKLTPAGVEVYDAWHFELERFFENNYLVIHRSLLDLLPGTRGTFTMDDNTYA